jgi:hypothetical protein
MSDAWEIQYPNDRVLITVDIEDCPLVEFPLCELFDLATSTLVDDYLEALQTSVTQVIEDTTCLDKKCKSRLLSTNFGVFHRVDDGAIFSMRKPALQRRIAQTLRSRTSGSHHPVEIPIFIRFMLPDIYLPPRRSEFPAAIPRVHHTDISQCSSPTTLQLSIPPSTVHGLFSNPPAPGTTPDLADSCGASATQMRHALQYDASATVPHNTTTFVPFNPAACFGAPRMSASGVAALDGYDIAMEDPVATIEATTGAYVGIAPFTGHTLSPLLCSSPAHFDSPPTLLARCELENASSAVLQNMPFFEAVLLVAADVDGSAPHLTPITLKVGVKLTKKNGLFVDGMRVPDEQAPGGFFVVTAAPMGPGIAYVRSTHMRSDGVGDDPYTGGVHTVRHAHAIATAAVTLRKYNVPCAQSGLLVIDRNVGFDHLQHTVPVYHCITATAHSYGFPLRGHDSGIRPRHSLPSLLTRYQPIDRGRCLL